nr:hypothetical protein [Tundra vole stool-associated circular virus]
MVCLFRYALRAQQRTAPLHPLTLAGFLTLSCIIPYLRMLRPPQTPHRGLYLLGTARLSAAPFLLHAGCIYDKNNA